MATAKKAFRGLSDLVEDAGGKVLADLVRSFQPSEAEADEYAGGGGRARRVDLKELLGNAHNPMNKVLNEASDGLSWHAHPHEIPDVTSVSVCDLVTLSGGLSKVSEFSPRIIKKRVTLCLAIKYRIKPYSKRRQKKGKFLRNRVFLNI